MTVLNMNLQLFGGGGSKSGLGGGGSGGKGGGKEQYYFTFGFKRADGTVRTHTVAARTKEEAERKADKYRADEGYVSRSDKSIMYTKEQYERMKKKKSK